MKELTPQQKERLTRSYNLRIERGHSPEVSIENIIKIVVDENKVMAEVFLKELANI